MSGLRLLVPAVVSAVLAGGSLAAQTKTYSRGQAPPIRAFPPGPDFSKLSPFALDSDHGSAFQIIPAAAMSPQDQELLANSESSLRQEAAFLGIGFNQGAWTHVQLACPSFPNHLLLRFERNNGHGDVSAFSGSIPRDNSGKVHVIPILRRSYSLWSPAPRNSRTIEIFNRLLSEEKTAEKPDWVGVASCYAALADDDPEVGSTPSTWSAMPQPILRLNSDGRAFISIVTRQPHPHRWELEFASDGRLVRAKSSFATGLVDSSGLTVPAANYPRTPAPATTQAQ